jgi:xanthine dehydrogenase YagS FAD-binding subunit
VVLGHVAPTPIVSDAAAKALEGKEVTEATATAAAEAAVEGVRPLSQNAYKVQLLKVAVKRAALLAAGAKPYWE